MNKIYYTVETVEKNIVITVDYPKALIRDIYDADRIAKAITSSVLMDTQ